MLAVSGVLQPQWDVPEASLRFAWMGIGAASSLHTGASTIPARCDSVLSCMGTRSSAIRWEKLCNRSAVIILTISRRNHTRTSVIHGHVCYFNDEETPCVT